MTRRPTPRLEDFPGRVTEVVRGDEEVMTIEVAGYHNLQFAAIHS